MKFKTLDGKEIRLEVSQQRYPLRSREHSRSNAQFHLGQQLQEIYKSVLILEEFGIPGTRLSLDFFIPAFQIAFEFQGAQHDEFNTLFHASKIDFIKQKNRDEQKKIWCEMNGIILIEVRDNGITIDELKILISEALNG